MIEIDLVRHVKVEGKPALYGCTDVSPIATENARLLKRLLAQQQTKKAYQRVFCSPLMRCHILAKEFSALCDLPLVISSDLQEMNFGCFDGAPFDELYFKDLTLKAEQQSKGQTALHWSVLERFFQAPGEVKLPGAETLSGFHHRVIQAWQTLIEQQVSLVTQQKETTQLTAEQKGSVTPKRILVVAHGGVIRMILAHILQLNWQQSSWHQKLQIGHGSLSRICISQPYQDRQLNKIRDKKQPRKTNEQPYQQLHQQVTTIAMPFLEEI